MKSELANKKSEKNSIEKWKTHKLSIVLQLILEQGPNQEEFLNSLEKLEKELSPFVGDPTMKKLHADRTQLAKEWNHLYRNAEHHVAKLKNRQDRVKLFWEQSGDIEKWLNVTRGHLEGMKEIYRDEVGFVQQDNQVSSITSVEIIRSCQFES